VAKVDALWFAMENLDGEVKFEVLKWAEVGDDLLAAS
jgi:hypothetical protein